MSGNLFFRPPQAADPHRGEIDALWDAIRRIEARQDHQANDLKEMETAIDSLTRIARQGRKKRSARPTSVARKA